MANNGNYNWDDSIEKDEVGFAVLPEGEYLFTVDKLEKSRVSKEGSKYLGCNMAVLTLEVISEKVKSKVFERIILNEAFESKISAFFRSIGAKKNGERIQMNWGAVEGKTGKAYIKVGKDTKGNDCNSVGYFMDYDGSTPVADEDLPF